MKAPDPTACEALERLFHEPHRLAIASALTAADGPVPFVALRDGCGLTDGNLNRHLRVLDEAGVVRLRKHIRGNRPLTTVQLTDRGLRRFGEYIEALGKVLEAARASLAADPAAAPSAARRARA